MRCERCGDPMSPKAVRGGLAKRYCSKRCQQRAYRAADRAAMCARARGDRERWPEKKRARNAVTNALRSGRLRRGDCEVGGDCAGRIEAHHPDYSKPLDVRWLCAKHHLQADSSPVERVAA